MGSRNWFDVLTRNSTSQRARRPRRTAERRRDVRKLFLESLEDRRVMAFNVLAEYATSPGSYDLALGPINADSQPDLVVLSGNGSVDVRLGSAGGAFAAPQSSATGASPGSVVEGDFTGDGIVDLLTASVSELSLLAGNGDGTFQPPQPVNGPASQSLSSVAAGDLNGDGKLDLAVAGQITSTYCPYYCYTSYDGYANVLLGNGTGGFSAPATTHLGTNRYPVAIEIGDVNGDSDADVITANTFTYDLSVLLGNGSGAVGSPNHSGYFGLPLPSISLGDVDGDGKTDTLTSSGNHLIVQKGNGLGTFTPLPALNTGNAVNSAVMGDVNADGKLDLVSAGTTNTYTCNSYGYFGCYSGYFTTSRHATVLLGNGQGGFALPLTSYFGSELGYTTLPDMALADLTGDGLPELATIDSQFNKAIILTNDGNWVAPTSISISDAAIVVEGNSGTVNAVFTVTIDGDHGAVSVGYAASDSNAVVGSDYVATSGTLTFSASEFTKTIVVPVKGDTLDEYDEQFVVVLSNLGGGLIFTDSLGYATIQDDDAAPLVTINDVSKSEGRRDYTPIDFTVSLSAPSGKEIYVEISTADGTATTANNDYYATSGTLYFGPGMTTAIVNTSIEGDTRVEANETFFVNLISAVDATIADAQGQGTIVNDDNGTTPPPKPTINIGDAEVVEGNSGTRQMTFTVSLSHASDQEVRVSYATANGTAKTGDNDYAEKSGTLRFQPGETSKTITISIKGDKKKESNEYFTVKLSNAVKGTLADSQGLGVILNDDGVSSSSSWLPGAVDAAIAELLAGILINRRR